MYLGSLVGRILARKRREGEKPREFGGEYRVRTSTGWMEAFHQSALPDFRAWMQIIDWQTVDNFRPAHDGRPDS
jgi:hypothetical protein